MAGGKPGTTQPVERPDAIVHDDLYEPPLGTTLSRIPSQREIGSDLTGTYSGFTDGRYF